MKRSSLLLCAGAVPALVAHASAATDQKAPKATAAPQNPNVILIYADDLGYGDLGCYGASRVETPNVDRLAREGTRFTNAHAVASTSTPSRYSLLTGQYAWRVPGTDVAVGNAGMIIRPERYTMADVMHNAGYRTAAFGKWHLGLGDKTEEQDWNAPLPTALGDIGFDYSYIMAATADRVPCVFIEDGKVANYDPDAPIEVSYRHPFPGEPTGRDNPEQLYNLRSSHGHDQAIVNGIGRIGYMRGGGKALWKDQNIADSITDHAIRFISQTVADTARGGQPFFIYLATNDVHVPRFPHERFHGRSPMGLRGEAIMQFDWTVGRVLDALDSLGIRDNTLVILSSDNGPVVDDGYADRAEELLGDHRPGGPWRGGKYSAYEAGTAIPMIVSWPGGGVPQGAETDALMSQIDWMASLASLVGARLPQGAAPDSRDHISTILGRDTQSRPWAVELANDHTLSLVTPQWKYIEPSDGPSMVPWGPKIETGYSKVPKLYDMTTPEGRAEQVSVAEQHPAVLFELQQRLKDVRNGKE